MKLHEWTQHYIKFQDCMKKQIQSIETTKEGFFVTEKKETKEYNIYPTLPAQIPLETKATKKIIITYNNSKNVHTIYNQWERVLTKNNLVILFVNTTTNEKWHLQPNNHHKISENIEKSLLILQNTIATQQE